jgi:hypothetical protein
LYTAPNIIGISESKFCPKNLEWRRPLGRPRRGGKDNIRMDLGERGWELVDYIYPAQNRDQWRTLMKTVKSLRIP